MCWPKIPIFATINTAGNCPNNSLKLDHISRRKGVLADVLQLLCLNSK